jgi:hypothetical protein
MREFVSRTEKEKWLEEASDRVMEASRFCHQFYYSEGDEDEPFWSRLREARWTKAEMEWLGTVHHALIAVCPMAESALQESRQRVLADDFGCFRSPSTGSIVVTREEHERTLIGRHAASLSLELIESDVPVNQDDADIWSFKNSEHLQRHSVGTPFVYPGVYFLLQGEEVIYVGQSADIPSRVLSHRRTKDFDRYATMPIPRDWLSEVEAEYILHYQPELNRSLPKNRWYQSAADASKTLGISSKQDIYRMCLSLKIEPTIFIGEIYYPVAKMQKAIKGGQS